MHHHLLLQKAHLVKLEGSLSGPPGHGFGKGPKIKNIKISFQIQNIISFLDLEYLKNYELYKKCFCRHLITKAENVLNKLFPFNEIHREKNIKYLAAKIYQCNLKTEQKIYIQPCCHWDTNYSQLIQLKQFAL